jgi:hypothetical protein
MQRCAANQGDNPWPRRAGPGGKEQEVMKASLCAPAGMLALTLALACASSERTPPGPPDQADAAAGGEPGTGGAGAPAVTGGSGGSGGKEATGGTGASPGTGGAEVVPDAAPTTADATTPGPDGAPAPTGGQVLFELTDPLPPLVMSHPSGDISWFDDPTEGKVVRLRAVDSNETKERGEFDMPKDVLQNGQTVWVGWRAKLEIPNPQGEWRNIFQEKSYGSYQENVPFCLRVDAGTMRLLDQGAKTIWTHAPILDKWFSILMKVVYGTGQNGTLELWIDGEPQKFTNGTMVGHLGTWGGGMQNMHWGVYRTARISGTDVHYISHLRVATTREAAAPP